MPTRPAHSVSAIALDSRRVLDALQNDAHDPEIKKRIGAREIATFAANLAALEAGESAKSTTLHLQVASGAHAGEIRARVLAFLANVRDDVKIFCPNDSETQHAFGVGAHPSPDSTSQVRHVAMDVLSAAHASPAHAKLVGLDAHGLHTLEDLIHSLDGADLAHVHTATGRHTNKTQTDSLAHLVSAETAHVRLVVSRVYRDDAAKLAPYARTLPRHEVTPRKKAEPPPAATTPTT
jgi:hypothetical protein